MFKCFCLLFCSALIPCWSAGIKSQGEVSMESRVFSNDHDSSSQDGGLGLFTRIEASYRQDGWRLRLRGFSRLDHEDEGRDLSALEEAWLGFKKKGWEVGLGFQMLNWTATEAFHPADLINSRNLDSNIENADKLGELMFSLRRRLGQGGLSFYFMPRLQEPVLPSSRSRLGFLPAGTSYTAPIWLVDAGDAANDHWADQWGLRFTQTLGDADLSFFYVDHLDRSQPLIVLNQSELGLLVTPAYFRVRNSGLTYLHVLGGLIFKLEAAHKDFIDHDGSVLTSNLVPGPLKHSDHTQLAFGLEFGLSHRRGSETTLLLEGQSFEGVSAGERASLSIFQRDILLGFRHAFNDTMSREFLFTSIWDVERNHELLVNFSYKQRISDTWSLQTGARWIDAPAKDSLPQGLEFLDESNQLFLNISRYF